jgi:hypothetical protein
MLVVQFQFKQFKIGLNIERSHFTLRKIIILGVWGVGFKNDK